MVKRFMLAVLLVIESALAMIPTSVVYAESASLLIYQLQTGVTGFSTQEYISIQNTSFEPIDVTGWCITKSSAADTTQSQLGCVSTSQSNVRILLPASGFLTLASNEFVTAHSGFVPDIIFNADLSASSGHIRLLNQAKQEIDRLGWGSAVHPEGAAASAHVNGKLLERVSTNGRLHDTDNNSSDFYQSILSTLPAISLYEEELPIDLCPNLDGLQASLPADYMQDQSGNCQYDVCRNLELLQIDIPDGYTLFPDGLCQLNPRESSILIITELLPNATGYDTGKEFIEIYNPNDKDVNIQDYVLQVGPSFAKSYRLLHKNIPPLGYLSLSDTEVGLVLPNGTASLRLIAPNGAIVSETDTYNSPEDDMAWTLLSEGWHYTNQPTPGLPNVASLEDSESTSPNENLLASCPPGQYRSSETNRCRAIQTSSSLTPCNPGQERNPETNRCRNTVLGVLTSLVACREGQERNPDTNRCRNITSSTLMPCAEGQERNPETNRCRKVGTADTDDLPKVQDVATTSAKVSVRWWLIGSVIIFALGYALYEWRQDIANIFHKRRLRLPAE